MEVMVDGMVVEVVSVDAVVIGVIDVVVVFVVVIVVVVVATAVAFGFVFVFAIVGCLAGTNGLVRAGAVVVVVVFVALDTLLVVVDLVGSKLLLFAIVGIKTKFWVVAMLWLMTTGLVTAATC